MLSFLLIAVAPLGLASTIPAPLPCVLFQMEGWTTASLTARDTGVSSECSSLNAVALSTTQKRCICRWPTG
jgi:hypothetical protein